MSALPTEPTVEQQLRLQRLEQLHAAWRQSRLPEEAVWHAHLRISTGGRERDLLLGTSGRAAESFHLLDWRTAPIAELFFTTPEGEPYELESDDRILDGTLLEKSRVELRGDALRLVQTSTHVFERDGEGRWSVRAGLPFTPLATRPEAERRRTSSVVEVRLDPVQRAAVELPEGRPLLVLGEAGFGKTTVALHRLARLRKQRGPEFRGAVVVPTEGLRRLTELLLARLGARDTAVWTYDKLAAALALKAFPDLPRRESEDAPAAAVRIKRHAAFREELIDYASRPPPRVEDEEQELAPEAVATTRRMDLQHLFGDRAVLDRVVKRARGEIPATMVGELLTHTKIQFGQAAEDEFRHVRADSRATVDGRSIDDGTTTHNVRTFDPEDAAVLFELERLRAQRGGQPVRDLSYFDAVVVDEAQELAPLELALLGRVLMPGGTLIVAGDAAQQVDPSASFQGWQAAMDELGHSQHQEVRLAVNYRCPPEVTALARRIAQLPEGEIAPRSGNGSPIDRFQVANEFEQVAFVTDALRDLEERDPEASIAVVCRTTEGAQRLALRLREGLAHRLSLEGRFDFGSGVTLSSVPEVKGLEFDYVLLPDAHATTYPETVDARRALYVATTRATHRLVLLAVGRPSPLLNP